MLEFKGARSSGATLVDPTQIQDLDEEEGMEQ
jgi:hypothetical protein